MDTDSLDELITDDTYDLLEGWEDLVEVPESDMRAVRNSLNFIRGKAASRRIGLKPIRKTRAY